MKTITEYHRPKSVDEALKLLARPNVSTVPVGGGSALVAQDRRDVQAVVDLRDLGLSYIRREGNTLHLGATTTLQTLIDAPDSAPAWGGQLALVARLTAARNLREQGTLAGTLASAAANNPLAVLLLALDASLTIHAPDSRTVALADFFSQRETMLRGALITQIQIPLPASDEAVAFKTVGRTPADLPIVCAAVRLRRENGTAKEVRVALGGVAHTPIRATRVEQAAEGRSLLGLAVDLAPEHLEPPSDFMGTTEYRLDMARVLTQRAFDSLQRSAME